MWVLLGRKKDVGIRTELLPIFFLKQPYHCYYIWSNLVFSEKFILIFIDGVFYEWRIKRLKQIAEIDKSTGMPRGGVYSNDAIKFEEYKFLEGNKEKYKTLFETFNKAFGRLVTKVTEFAQLNLKNINISLDETDVIANELKKYDEIVVKESQTHLMPVNFWQISVLSSIKYLARS